jgi:hypothetical protein
MYTTTRPTPPARLLIRIRRQPPGPAAWLSVPLLATAPGWVCVDADGPLWVMWEAVHSGDRETLATFERLKERMN